MDCIRESEVLLRLAFVGGTLALMVLLEAVFPRRQRIASRWRRWTTNLSISALSTLVVRGMALAAIPITAAGAAVWAQNHEFGLLNLLALDWHAALVASLVVLDLAIWLQHLASHRVALLWRVHAVHHADQDMDATTALRFHPIEIGLSMLFKAIVVLLLGAPLYAVVLFEIGLSAFALFNHTNLNLPQRLDALLRLVLVTPDVHRVHHSTRKDEQNSNFGFSTSLWDRLFGSYRAQAREPHDSMTLGLASYQQQEGVKLLWSLLLPVRSSEQPADPTE